MLDIVPSWNPAHQRKKNFVNLRKWQKNLISGPFFFPEFYLYYYLDIVPNYHPKQFKRKVIKQTRDNDDKPNFGPILEQLTQIWAPKFFSWVLPCRFTLSQGIIIFNFKRNV